MGIPKSGRGRLRELFITKFKSQFKWGFAKVVVTRAGRLREWSRGELRLYFSGSFVTVTMVESNSDGDVRQTHQRIIFQAVKIRVQTYKEGCTFS